MKKNKIKFIKYFKAQKNINFEIFYYKHYL